MGHSELWSLASSGSSRTFEPLKGHSQTLVPRERLGPGEHWLFVNSRTLGPQDFLALTKVCELTNFGRSRVLALALLGPRDLYALANSGPPVTSSGPSLTLVPRALLGTREV